MMKKTMIAAALAVGMAAVGASAAQAAPVQKSPLRSFGTGTVQLVGSNGADLTVAEGQYAGVYVNGKRTSGKALSAVDYSFNWEGAISGGSPRFSVPIDENGDSLYDGYAFIDAANAGGVSGENGKVSTESLTTPVWYGSTKYDNWDAFADDKSTSTISKETPFVIADQPGTVSLTNVAFWAA